MQKFKVKLVFEIEAEDIDEARDYAYDMAVRGNDSFDGELGECIARDVELLEEAV